MKEVCGMNPLCVCFETTKVTELGQRNLDNISKMGIDVIHFKKNYNAYRSMVKEGFIRVGDEMWPNHIGIFTIPINIATKIQYSANYLGGKSTTRIWRSLGKY